MRGATELNSKTEVTHFNIHSKIIEKTLDFIPSKESVTIAITSGASCPDASVDQVIKRLLEIFEVEESIEQILN